MANQVNEAKKSATRELDTVEQIGTEVISNKTGKIIGTITGSYVGGFVITDLCDVQAMLPFKSVGNYSVVN